MSQKYFGPFLENFFFSENLLFHPSSFKFQFCSNQMKILDSGSFCFRPPTTKKRKRSLDVMSGVTRDVWRHARCLTSPQYKNEKQILSPVFKKNYYIKISMFGPFCSVAFIVKVTITFITGHVSSVL